MEKMIDLRDLLKHELMDLYSAEEQIIEAMPSMIEKANNDKLKTTLREHLKITEKQKTRLEEIQKLLGESEGKADVQTDTDAGTENKSGFISRLFGGSGAQKCKGMEGLISEGEKIMGEDMTPEVLDAAIIASAQKIEHYEICGYGTARAYARELNLGAVAEKLEETLNEEYSADDLLTDLAVGKVNVKAEFAEQQETRGRRLRTGQAVSNADSNGRGTSSNGRGTTKSSRGSNGRGTTKSSRGSTAKTNSGGNGRAGSDRRKSTQAKSSSASSRSSSKSSAPSKSSVTRSAGRTNASNGRSKTSKTTSQGKNGSNSRGSSKKSVGRSSSGNRSKSSGSKGSRR